MIGHVLSERYRILDVIGDGGMGRVYAAEHVSLRRKLAIKVLKPELAQLEANVERFLQEARAASMIAHPNVVDIIDFGRIPGGPVFFAMEFLEGEDLAMLLRRQGRLPWPRVQQILLQVVRGLAAAHKCGVVHRDMKPANIFLVRRPDAAEQVKLLDFGIAKLTTADRPGSLTGEGSVFGTARYMSPEQAAGLPVDGRSDVYALGIVAYEMLSGRVPFDSDNFMRVASQHINEEIVPLRRFAPELGLSDIIEAVVMKALGKRPGDRYATMADFEAALMATSFESTVAVANPLAAELVDRTAIYDTTNDVDLARPDMGVNVDATVVRPRPTRGPRSSPPARVVHQKPAAPLAAPRVTGMRGPSMVSSMNPVPPPDLDDDYQVTAVNAPSTGEFLAPILPAGMAVPSSEPIEHRTLPPVNWSGGNPATFEHARRGDGAETHEFALNVPRREVSRNWLVITVSIVVLALIWGGGAAWFIFMGDEGETAPEVHPVVTADEPRPTVVVEKIKPAAPKPETPPVVAPRQPEPPAEDPPPPRTTPGPRSQPRRDAAPTPTTLGQRELDKGFARAKGAIAACGRTHGAIEGTGFDVTFEVRGGRAVGVSVQRPHHVTPLGRCVADAVSSSARFAESRQPVTGVTRRVKF